MKRALISVYDKVGIEKLAKNLIEQNYEIICSGGTYKLLSENKIKVLEISEVTGFQEILDGRVKTLHPAIHAGILARRENKQDIDTLNRLNISAIDVVVVNLYPFFEKQKMDLKDTQLLEFIDIGGPTMLRSAAKNFKDVVVITNVSDYDEFIERLKNNRIDYEYRKRLAAKVFALSSAYDAAIARFLGDFEGMDFAPFSYKLSSTLRYGENPHQKGWLYLDTNGKGIFNNFEILNGKELSYNNIKDIDSAIKIIFSFEKPTIAAVKHNVPCAVASLDEKIDILFDRVYNADTVSIFGGIVASNRTIDSIAAEKMAKIFLEVIVAPDFTDDAIGILKKKKNLRIIKIKSALYNNSALSNKSALSNNSALFTNFPLSNKYEFTSVDGGLLVQQVDSFIDNQSEENFKIVTEKKPAQKQIQDLIFAQIVTKFVKSNAIVTAKDGVTCGICGGQTNRIWSALNALQRTPENAVLASDAFFPFPDVVEQAYKHKISAIIQPGGSIKDQESIDLCNKYGIPMVFTGIRHFKH